MVMALPGSHAVLGGGVCGRAYGAEKVRGSLQGGTSSGRHALTYNTRVSGGHFQRTTQADLQTYAGEARSGRNALALRISVVVKDPYLEEPTANHLDVEGAVPLERLGGPRPNLVLLLEALEVRAGIGKCGASAGLLLLQGRAPSG